MSSSGIVRPVRVCHEERYHARRTRAGAPRAAAGARAHVRDARAREHIHTDPGHRDRRGSATRVASRDRRARAPAPAAAPGTRRAAPRRRRHPRPRPLASPSPPAQRRRAAPAGPAFPPDWPYPQGAPSPRSARAMVVTDDAIATKVGADVLAAGGNAVDAAVATAFALAVAFPTAGNIGGGGFLVARDGRQRRTRSTSARSRPAAATRDMYLGADGKPTGESREGWRSAGVPGSVAGLWEAWHTLGSKKKTWAELLAPAIDLAEQGFVVDEAFAKTIEIVQTRLAKYPASAALFLPDGAPPAVGHDVARPRARDRAPAHRRPTRARRASTRGPSPRRSRAR